MKEKKHRDSVKKDASSPNAKIKAAAVEKHITEIISGTVESLGFLLWSVEFTKTGGEWALAITIDRPAGFENKYVSMDDCMIVFKSVDPLLDEADPIPGAYTLEISSPGLNRALKTDAHLSHYMGKNIILTLYAKDDAINKKIILGCLLSFDSSSVAIKPEDGGETLIFTRKSIAKINAADEGSLEKNPEL